MALSNSQIQERIKNPVERNQLRKAVELQNWVRFHAEEAIDRGYTTPYVVKYEKWVESLLPSDKYSFFLRMMRYPIYTNGLVTTMQDEFNGVFDSQNSSFTFEFSNESLQADFIAYLNSEKFFEKWVNESKNAMLKKTSSICIIDLPKDPQSSRAEPYFYFQDIAAVVDIDYVRDIDNAIINAVIVRHDKNTIFFVDDIRYAWFKKTDESEDFTMASEVFHELGYCPACFFWKESIKSDEPIVKKSLITGELNNLDFLLTAENWRRCLESYAAFPILEKLREDCSYYENIDSNQTINCVDGWLQYPGAPKRCPVCEKNQTVGPGTTIEVNPQSSKDDVDNTGKTRFVSADKDSLDYWASRTNELWDEIFYDCVGTTGEAMVQAINKEQVHGNHATKQKKNMKAVGNMEPSVNFILSTFARLRYPGQFIRGKYSMGTRFFDQTPKEAQEEYKGTKSAGAPAYQVSYKREQVDAVNTKGNPVDAEKIAVLQDLEPFVDMSISECKNMGFDVSFPELFGLKSQFSDCIKRFERENGSIVEFGSKLDYSVKIDKISKVLKGYVAIPIPPKPEPVNQQ